MATALLLKTKTWKRRAAAALAGAVLAAGILGAKTAKADPPARDHIDETYSVTGGARLSLSSGLSFDPFSQSLSYSGFSYGLGDDDFKLRLKDGPVDVVDFLTHHDYSDESKLGDLLDFSHTMLDDLGADSPGTYHHRLSASLEAFGEGYSRYSAYLGRQRRVNEVGLSAYVLARGTAHLDLHLDYDNPILPTYLDSNLSAGYRASMLTRTELGMESTSERPWGFGFVAGKSTDLSSYGWVRANLDYSLGSGFDADVRSFYWRQKTERSSFLPYATLSFSHEGVRYYLNAGPALVFEHGSEKTDRNHFWASEGSGSDEEVQRSDHHSMRVEPAVSALMAFENLGDVIPVVSFSNRDVLMARGTLGLRLGRAFLSGSADTSRYTSSELLIPLSGTLRREDFRDYLVSTDAAKIGFFPSRASRQMDIRHRFITSSPGLIFRNAVSYDREFSELRGESGIILNRGNFFVDSGIEAFGGDNFGGGLYGNIGTRDFYLSSSYSSTFGGAGTSVQSLFFSIGGTLR